MNDAPDDLAQLYRLTSAQCDGILTPEQGLQLEGLVLGSEELRYHYILSRHIHALAQLGRCVLTSDSEADEMIVAKPTAPHDLPDESPAAIPVPVVSAFNNRCDSGFGYLLSGWPAAYLIATVIFAIGALVGAFTYVLEPAQVAERRPAAEGDRPAFGSEKRSVGRITGVFDCRWSDATAEAQLGVRVPIGSTYALDSGLMEITYDSGAKVLLEGPVRYRIDSNNGGFLSNGKLTGKVEVATARGFGVQTPSAIVTDLGTEFGVQVDQQGTTTSRVFRGAVTLQARSADGATHGGERVFRAGEAARIGPERNSQITLLNRTEKSPAFVREIPAQPIKTLDLVDVVAGGDGFSGHRGASIDPTSGRRSSEVLIKNIHTSESPQYRVVGKDLWAVGDAKFHRADELPFVDGVFIPDGGKGPITVDSAGHTFDLCPETSNYAPHLIWAGGDFRHADFHTTINGVDYAKNGHGLLRMHANLGITFDLDAIRKANPAWTVQRFLAVLANLEMKSKDGVDVSADYWVLVDGYGRSHCQHVNAFTGAIPISIKIKPTDRYLTLISTDHNKDINGDLIVFGDPRLELVLNNDRQASLPENRRERRAVLSTD